MITLDAKIAFLLQPASYPEHVYRIETVETHMSWIFLTEQHAYKLKKPVDYGIPDFSTLEARRFFCEEEIRLNRRLTMDVYIATLPLVVNTSGHLEIAGPGPAVDWLVKMRRLPVQRMLDYMIKAGSVQEGDMVRIAERLSVFYRDCLPVQITPDAYRLRFAEYIAQCRHALADPAFGIPGMQLDEVISAQQEALVRIAFQLDERVRARRIVEGHGDLRTEHVCLENAVDIIDCLEFSRELRLIDPLDELAFLALECERVHASGLGETLLNAYGVLSGDTSVPSLIHFYKSIRAGMRARLAIRHLAEEKFRYSPEWPRRTATYLKMALDHAQKV